ncbi:MAG: hypothetical protein KAH22_01895 [Thiotrichaceae bacterium]|nr:hypothetical protein [Thiotrichaceae bacterium]
MNIKNIAVSVLIAPLLMITGDVSSASSKDASLKKLAALSVFFASKGFSCRNSASGKYLAQGNTYTVYTDLYKENAYILVAAGNEHVKDIDIILHDQNHNVISKDGSTDPIPMVTVSPKWSGSFHAKVKMYRGRGYSNLMVCWKKR